MRWGGSSVARRVDFTFLVLLGSYNISILTFFLFFAYLMTIENKSFLMRFTTLSNIS